MLNAVYHALRRCVSLAVEIHLLALRACSGEKKLGHLIHVKYTPRCLRDTCHMETRSRSIDVHVVAGANRDDPDQRLPSHRLRREAETVSRMVKLYCADLHRSEDGLCDECKGLIEYAAERLARCPFGTEKTVCSKCPIHCYRPQRRQQIREVMRYAGPRMVLRHPWSAMRHLLDKLRPASCPPVAGRKSKKPTSGSD